MADITVLGLGLDYSALDSGARQAERALDRVEDKMDDVAEANRRLELGIERGLTNSFSALARELKTSEAGLTSFLRQYSGISTAFQRGTLIVKTFGTQALNARQELDRLAASADKLGTIRTPDISNVGGQSRPKDNLGVDRGLDASFSSLARELKTSEEALSSFLAKYRTVDDDFTRRGLIFKKFGAQTREIRNEVDRLAVSFDKLGVRRAPDLGNAGADKTGTKGDGGIGAGAADAAGSVTGLTASLVPVGAALGPVGAALTTVATALGGVAVGAVTAAGALLLLSVRGAEAAREFDAISTATGVNAQKLLLYKVAAEQTGTSLNDYADALKNSTDKAREAAAGDEQLRKIFRALGVDAKQAATDPATAFENLVSKIAAVEPPVLRAKAAQELLGTSSEAAIASFINFARNSDELKRRLVELGVTLGGDAVRGAKKITDELAILGVVTESTTIKIANKAAPGIVTGLQSIENALIKLEPVGSRVGAILSGAFALAARNAEQVATGLDFVLTRLGLLEKKTQQATPTPASGKPDQPDPYAELRKLLAGTGKNKGSGNAEAEARQLRESRLAIERGTAEQIVSIYRGVEAQQTVLLQSGLNERIVSIREFYGDAEKLAKETLEKEIAAQQVQRRAVLENRRRLEVGGVTRKERAEYNNEQAKLLGIQTRIVELEDQAAVKSIRNTQQREQAYHDLEEAARGVARQLAEIDGEAIVSGQDKFLDQIKQFKVNGLSRVARDAEKLLGILQSRAGASRAGEGVDIRQQQLSLDIQKVQNQVTLGVIGEGQARERVLALQREARGELAKGLEEQLQKAEKGRAANAVAAIKERSEAFAHTGAGRIEPLTSARRRRLLER